MKTVGIITEYNPFHLGHAWQLEQIRKLMGQDCALIVAMSGSFTQRGEPAILDKWLRTRAALLNGVDLVLELPFVFATASAERFAAGGVRLLAATGIVHHLAFGSESGQLTDLQTVADLLVSEPEAYRERLKENLDAGDSYAAARQKAVGAFLGRGDLAALLGQANNILAIEYLKAIQTLPGPPLQPLVFPRLGQNYQETRLDPAQPRASAAAIRQAIIAAAGSHRLSPKRNHPDMANLAVSLSHHMPAASAAVLLAAIQAGEAPVLSEDLAAPVLMMLRSHTTEELARCQGMQEGLAQRLMEAARRPLIHASDQIEGQPADLQDDQLADHRYSQLVEAAATRRFPRTRVQRSILAALAGINRDDPAVSTDSPQYLRVLGFSKNGRYLLKLMRNKASLPIITKGSDFLEYAQAKSLVRQAQADCLATDLWMLAAGRQSGQDFDRAVVIR